MGPREVEAFRPLVSKGTRSTSRPMSFRKSRVTSKLLSCLSVIDRVDNRVFHSLYKVGRNGNFVFKGFNNSKKKLPPVGLNLMLQIITGLGVQCLTKSHSSHYYCQN